MDGGAFEASALERINFPRTLRMIGPRAFYACERLRRASLSAQPELLGDCCFAHSGLEVFEVSEASAGAARIPNFAFWGCGSLREVKFVRGARVLEVGEGAFAECGFSEAEVEALKGCSEEVGKAD